MPPWRLAVILMVLMGCRGRGLGGSNVLAVGRMGPQCTKNCVTHNAQFIAVCRRSKFGYTRTSRLRRGSPLCTRLALKRRGDTQRLSQVLRATKCDKLSDLKYPRLSPCPVRLFVLPTPKGQFRLH